MSNEAKLIRGQLRQIVKEMLPEVLKEEIFKEMDAKIQKSLQEMQTRHKDVMSYLVRNVSTPAKSEDKK